MKKTKAKQQVSRCTAKIKTGKRCTAQASKGNRCGKHPLKKTGRKLLKLDADKIGSYARLGASNRLIAALCGCNEGTIRNRFSELVRKKDAEGQIELLMWQRESAKAGTPSMLIWNGKQRLDQKEPRQSLEHLGAGGGPIQHTTRDLSNWTEEELEHAKRLAGKLADDSGD